MIQLPFDINEAEWQVFDEGVKSCVWKPDEKCCVQYWEDQPGTGAAPHSHPAEQITYVQSGYMELTMDGKSFVLSPGSFACIPPNVVHSTKNVGNSVVVNIDFFMPDRDDRFASPRATDLGHGWTLDQ